MNCMEKQQVYPRRTYKDRFLMVPLTSNKEFHQSPTVSLSICESYIHKLMAMQSNINEEAVSG